MSKSGKAALTKGAVAIRKAELEANASDGKQLVVKSQRDQIADRIAAEIRRLHEELWGKKSLGKVIRIGELLARERKYQQGEWRVWLQFNVSFSHDTATRYMDCYERREELAAAGISTVSDAYHYLFGQGVKRLKSTEAGLKLRQLPDEQRNVETNEKPTQPERKSVRQIMAEITPNAQDEHKAKEEDIHQRLSAVLEEVGSLDHATSAFVCQLSEDSKALIAQCHRLHGLFKEHKNRQREESARFVREKRQR